MHWEQILKWDLPRLLDSGYVYFSSVVSRMWMSQTHNVRYEPCFSFFSSVTWGLVSSGMQMNRSGENQSFSHVSFSFFSSELVSSVIPKNQSAQILLMNSLDQVASGMQMNQSEKNRSFSLFSLQQVFSEI